MHAGGLLFVTFLCHSIVQGMCPCQGYNVTFLKLLKFSAISTLFMLSIVFRAEGRYTPPVYWQRRYMREDGHVIMAEICGSLMAWWRFLLCMSDQNDRSLP